MCRLAAYLGPEISLSDFLMVPEHSLYMQSYAPAEMEEAILNADGFGFCWYPQHEAPAVYKNTCPIWTDRNLINLGTTLTSNLWLANVRSATPGQPVSQDNTQPFRSGPYTFMHNGFIDNFSDKMKIYFHEYLAADIQAGIQGNTDSEYLFALFRQSLQSNEDDLVQATKHFINELHVLLDSTKALVNIMLSDGKLIIASRYAFNGGKCPTLYWAEDLPSFQNARLIASERFTNDDKWNVVKDNHLIVFADDTPASLIEI